MAAISVRSERVDAEASIAIQGGEIDGGGKAVRLAEDHEAAIGISGRADHEVGKAIAIHIAGGGDSHAGTAKLLVTIEAKAGDAVQPREVDGGGKAACLAKHHIADADDKPVNQRGGSGTDDDVGIAITIHITGRGDGIAGPIITHCAFEAKAVGAVEAGEVDGGCE